MTANTTATDAEDQMSTGQLLATAGICLVAMMTLVGAVVYSGGIAMPDVLSSDNDPATAADDNETDTDDDSDDDDGLLPGANENRTDDDGDDPPDDSSSGGPGEGDDSEGTDGSENGDDVGDDEEAGNEPTVLGPFTEVTSSPMWVESGQTAEWTIRMETVEPASGTAKLVRADTDEVVDTDEYETDSEVRPGIYDGWVNVEYTPEVEEDTEIEFYLETDHGTYGLGTLEVFASDNGGGGEWNQSERDEAAEMIAQYYEGYLSGISQATDSGWANEQAAIRDDEGAPGAPMDPWPLEEWDSPEDAFKEGEEIGAGEGAEPIESEYNDKRDEHTNDSDGDSAGEDSDSGMLGS